MTGQPATAVRSLMGIGTPWKRGSSTGSVRTTASAAAWAAWRASSSLRQMTATSRSLSASMRASVASRTSTGLTCLDRMAAAT